MPFSIYRVPCRIPQTDVSGALQPNEEPSRGWGVFAFSCGHQRNAVPHLWLRSKRVECFITDVAGLQIPRRPNRSSSRFSRSARGLRLLPKDAPGNSQLTVWCDQEKCDSSPLTG